MVTRTRLLIVGLVAVWAISVNEVPVAANDSSHVCSEVCGGSSCDQECWLTQFDFDNDYPSTTCGAESYACCGDGVCDPTNEYCFACSEDCNETTGSVCDDECADDSYCDAGEKCNAMHECVVPAPNNNGNGDTSCSNKNNCYGPDACMASGDCALPWKDECSGGWACTSTAACKAHFTGNDDVYCNPGNSRCMNTLTPGCPL
jgi:hypothetical protein